MNDFSLNIQIISDALLFNKIIIFSLLTIFQYTNLLLQAYKRTQKAIII